MNNKICFGCGCKLQFDDKEKEGYIPREKYDNSVYCQRCFRLMHYGDEKKVNTPKSINSILKTINDGKKYVIFLANFITLNEDIIKVFKSIKQDKMLVISKCDIIPKSCSFSKVIDYLKSYYKIDDEIRMISSNTGYGVNTLVNYLYYKRLNEIYIVGETNSGKSSLINAMMEAVDSNLNRITVSKMRNTTLDYLRIKLNDNLLVVDSPGFVLNDKNMLFNKLIKPKTYQMKEGETLLVGNRYFSFNKNTSVTIYMGDDILIKKYYKDVIFDGELDLNMNVDLVIKGEGFINIKKECTIKYNNLDKEDIEVRKSIFGGTDE